MEHIQTDHVLTFTCVRVLTFTCVRVSLFITFYYMFLVIAIMIITIVIGSYRWNAKRVKDNMMTRTELNDRSRGFVLPDFAPHGESRLITNPLYNSDGIK